MKMKKILSMVLVAAFAVSMIGCGSKDSGAATDEKVLRVGMEGTYAPYTYHDEDGNLTGFEVDVANAIGEKMGYKVEFVETVAEEVQE